MENWNLEPFIIQKNTNIWLFGKYMKIPFKKHIVYEKIFKDGGENVLFKNVTNKISLIFNGVIYKVEFLAE